MGVEAPSEGVSRQPISLGAGHDVDTSSPFSSSPKMRSKLLQLMQLSAERVVACSAQLTQAATFYPSMETQLDGFSLYSSCTLVSTSVRAADVGSQVGMLPKIKCHV